MSVRYLTSKCKKMIKTKFKNCNPVLFLFAPVDLNSVTQIFENMLPTIGKSFKLKLMVDFLVIPKDTYKPAKWHVYAKCCHCCQMLWWLPNVTIIEMKGKTRCKLTIISEAAVCKKFIGQIVSYPTSQQIYNSHSLECYVVI